MPYKLTVTALYITAYIIYNVTVKWKCNLPGTVHHGNRTEVTTCDGH